MTLREAIGVAVDTDIATGRKLTYSEIYGRAIEYLGGLKVIGKYLPYSLNRIRQALKTDPHMNNLPIEEWDLAAGFVCYEGKCEPTGGGLWPLYHYHGINIVSCAEGVCILKEAARRLAG